jgi:hypothetical protein
MQDAVAKGRIWEWQQIVGDPRYAMRQFRRTARPEVAEASILLGSGLLIRRWRPPIHGDWSVPEAGGGNNRLAIDPARLSAWPGAWCKPPVCAYCSSVAVSV